MIRTDLHGHWSPTLPEDQRAHMLTAWREGRSCADCRHWERGEPGDLHGACGLVTLAAFITPEDYTCDQFTKENA